MWECPDFFGLEDKHVLICSPQSMKADKYEFHNGHNSVYFLGDYDKENHVFIKEEPHTLDYGMDFYAATDYTASGRTPRDDCLDEVVGCMCRS